MSFKIETDNDLLDEHNGAIRVMLESGDGYVEGTPNAASVTVVDNDKPPMPTVLRVNGHLGNQGVTLRWAQEDPRYTTFDARYVLDSRCPMRGECADSLWTEVPGLTLTPPPPNIEDTTQAKLPMTAGALYRVAVRVRQAENGNWSDFRIVYPTTFQLVKNRLGVEKGYWRGREIITSTANVAQVGNNLIETFQTDGRFVYRICLPPPGSSSDSDPTDLPGDFTVAKLATIISAWDFAVRWDKDDGSNIIQTSGEGTNACEPLSSDTYQQQNSQVVFFKEDRYFDVCPPPSIACWGQTGNLATANKPYTIALNVGENWTKTLSDGCTQLHVTLRHEVGHALGFFHSDGGESLMSRHDERRKTICNPTPWDAGAAMANYQSR